MKITDHDLYPFGLIHGVAGGRLRLFSGPRGDVPRRVERAAGAIGTFYNLWDRPAPRPRRHRSRRRRRRPGVHAPLPVRIATPSPAAVVVPAGRDAREVRDRRRMPRPPLVADGEWSDARVRELITRVTADQTSFFRADAGACATLELECGAARNRIPDDVRSSFNAMRGNLPIVVGMGSRSWS